MEVICKTSEKLRRFAVGTESGFAVSCINRKLGAGAKPIAVYIEAAKEGEEPVNFGPNALLMDYGDGWRLQTVTEVDLSGNKCWDCGWNGVQSGCFLSEFGLRI